MGNFLSIKQILARGFGTIFVLIIAAFMVTQYQKNQSFEYLEKVAGRSNILHKLTQLDLLLVEAETSQRGYLYTGQETFLEPYTEANTEINVAIADLKENIYNPKNQQKINELQILIKERINYLDETIQLRKFGREQEVKNIVTAGTGVKIMARVRAKLSEIKAAENQLLDDSRKFAAQAENFSTYFALSVAAIIVAVGVLISLVILRRMAQSLGIAVAVAEEVSAGKLTANIEASSNDGIGKLLVSLQTMIRSLNASIKQVQKSEIQVTTSALQIAASGKQLEATVTQEAASIIEVEYTTKEIAATSRQLRQTIEEITSAFQNTAMAAGGGKRNLSEMGKTMRQLVNATTSISSKLSDISEKANNINRIITTITKVADRTNLLSLNAAIESEKAGKYGRGFAVVSTEIRRLADQTAVATLDIEKMVKEMQTAVSSGVTEMDDFSQRVSQSVEDVESVSWQLTEIIEQVQSITPRFEVVNHGMEAQSEGAQQISEVMLHLSETSSQTAEALCEINGAISELNNAAQSLHHEMSRFTVIRRDEDNV